MSLGPRTPPPPQCPLSQAHACDSEQVLRRPRSPFLEETDRVPRWHDRIKYSGAEATANGEPGPTHEPAKPHLALHAVCPRLPLSAYISRIRTADSPVLEIGIRCVTPIFPCATTPVWSQRQRWTKEGGMTLSPRTPSNPIHHSPSQQCATANSEPIVGA